MTASDLSGESIRGQAPTNPSSPSLVREHAETPNAAGRGVPAPSHRESDLTYPSLATLSDKWRVINCKDDIQWIVQRREGQHWRGVSFHLDRDVLIERALKFEPAASPEALAILRALPARHPDPAPRPRHHQADDLEKPQVDPAPRARADDSTKAQSAATVEEVTS